MVAAFAAAGAIAAGVVLQLIHPIHVPKATAPPPPPAPAAPFTAVSGWDCGVSGTSYGFDAHGRTSAWYTVPSGGWAQDGCHGTFEAIPMTGKKATDDASQFAEWWFKPSPAMTQCVVTVYVPAAQRRQDSAATAAQFYVLSGQNGTRLARFVLDETANPGSRPTAGTFPVSQDGIAVELVDRGVAATPPARLAVTQVKVRCTG